MAVNFVASGSEGAHDPEGDCRTAEVSVQGRLQVPHLGPDPLLGRDADAAPARRGLPTKI